MNSMGPALKPRWPSTCGNQFGGQARRDSAQGDRRLACRRHEQVPGVGDQNAGNALMPPAPRLVGGHSAALWRRQSFADLAACTPPTSGGIDPAASPSNPLSIARRKTPGVELSGRRTGRKLRRPPVTLAQVALSGKVPGHHRNNRRIRASSRNCRRQDMIAPAVFPDPSLTLPSAGNRRSLALAPNTIFAGLLRS